MIPPRFLICLALAGQAIALLCDAVPARGQSQTDIDSRKVAAYQRFHQGEVRQAAADLRRLIDETADKTAKAYLLRDLAEICAADVNITCTVPALTEAFSYANADLALKPLVPELYSYLIEAEVRSDHKEDLDRIFQGGTLRFFDTQTNPAAAARAYLAAAIYFLRYQKRQAAESSLSWAIMSLLLIDPKQTYSIAKNLIGILEVMIVAQDLVGANALTAVIAPYLSANLDRRGPDWAQYKYLVAQFLALANQHRLAIPALAEATALYARQNIDQDQKDYVLATSNSLQSLALVLDGDLAKATEVHASHPFQPRRSAIIAAGQFATIQEFYFAVSDTLIQHLSGTGAEQDWKSAFEAPLRWQFQPVQGENIDSYRNFALALIAPRSSQEAAELMQRAVRQRISVSDDILKNKFEGFPLPSSIDQIMIMAGLSSTRSHPPADQYDLMLKGGELMLRSLRHQLSDFAVLMGSQATERARNNARSFNLVSHQKRNWELQQIGALLAGTPRDPAALAATYSDLVDSVSRLKATLSTGQDYAEASGYASVRDIQAALDANEIFVSYFPTAEGIGRLCIAKTFAIHSVAAMNGAQWLGDLKLLKAALTADYAPDEALDIQFPVGAAIRIRDVLFSGLERCMHPGVHVNVALPNDAAGVPLAALLKDEPPRFRDGYDLTAAKWLGNTYSFSVTVSARNFLGSRRSIARRFASRSYLAIGDPDFSHLRRQAEALRAGPARSDLYKTELLALDPIPETADEIRKVRQLVGAGTSRVLTGSQATEESFRSSELGAYDIVHFATHGLFKDDIKGLAEPALVLTPADLGDGFDDGLLTVSEIARLSLNARLVVLSACNTARVDAGTAALGEADLQAAFAAAGAPSLVASLWSVETTTAHDLMVGFFEIWRQQKSKSASAALAEAARRFLKRADRSRQHPRFWAAFIVLGEGGRLPEPAAANGLGVDDYTALRDGFGVVVDAKQRSEAGLFFSVEGIWSGTATTSASGAIDGAAVSLRSQDIGAGRLVADGNTAYALNYSLTAPLLRRIDAGNRLVWRKDFPDLRTYVLSGIEILNGVLYLVGEGPLQGFDSARTVVLIKIDKSGKEVGRRMVEVAAAPNLIGPSSVLRVAGDRLLLVLNSKQPPVMRPSGPNAVELPRSCEDRIVANVSVVDPVSLALTPIHAIANFQAADLRQIGPRTIVGGQTREDCWKPGRASLLELTPTETATLWQDDDPFTSIVQSFDRIDAGIALLIRRQRPVGLGFGHRVTALTKRWGDGQGELYEFSLLDLAPDGRPLRRYDSSFGLSALVQGMIVNGGRRTVYGSLGGRPAISLKAGVRPN